MAYQFQLEDIIVYNGIITKLGVLQGVISPSYDIRLATEEEKQKYYNRPDK